MSLNFINKFFKKEQKNLVQLPFKIKAEDFFLVSFPKSGSTWLRFLLGNYITKGHVSFDNLNYVMPDIHTKKYPTEFINTIETKPRIIKSHHLYTNEYPNVIYIVRDGRDMAISLYHHWLMVKFIPKETTFDSFLENYFYKEYWFSRWDKHIFSWLRDNKHSNILWIRYEDLLSSPYENCVKVLNFLNLEIDSITLNNAIELSTFKKMRQAEEESVKITMELTALTNRTPLPNSYFMRQGTAGNWRKSFSQDQAKKFADECGEALKYMDYELY